MAALSPLSDELALVAACDLAGDGELLRRLAAAQQSSFDWDRFAFLARGNAMAGLVAARLDRVAPDVMPEPVAAILRADLQANAVVQLAQTAAAARLSQSLAAAGVRSIVLKGMALSHMLYPADPHWRSSGDIDILIDQVDRPVADRILAGQGYRRRWPEAGMPPKGQDMFLLLANVFDYASPVSGQLVELHHRITLNPSWMPGGFDELYGASVEIETARGPIRGLDGSYLVSYLCWHAFAHFGFRMKWFCDIVRALQRAGAGSCAALCPAEEGFAQGPLALADALIGAILPAIEGARATAAPDGLRDHANRILADMEHPTNLPTARSLALLPGELAFRLFLMRLSPGWRGKGYELLRATSDPRDVAVLRLGKRFAALYALAGPLLAIRRFVLARGGRQEAVPHLH